MAAAAAASALAVLLLLPETKPATYDEKQQDAA
jgi:hypothetical protein